MEGPACGPFSAGDEVSITVTVENTGACTADNVRLAHAVVAADNYFIAFMSSAGFPSADIPPYLSHTWNPEVYERLGFTIHSGDALGVGYYVLEVYCDNADEIRCRGDFIIR